MEDITLVLAILLAAGFLAAKIGQYFKLPSVTGYICVGLLLGPVGLNLLTEDVIRRQLGHFTQIALMLIAFGIGEHLELKKVRHSARDVITISVADVAGAFLLVTAGTFVVTYLTGVGDSSWTAINYLILAILLGTVAMATAPAAIMHVMKELRATGRFTTTLLQIVAVDNGLAIMMFGVTVAVVGAMVSDASGTMMGGIAGSFIIIIVSLLLGAMTGLFIDIVFRHLRQRGEMLIAGLALLLLCGEGARLLDLSPLLAGMAAGFIIVNRDYRDVRLFRVLNAFEAPIYVLFFTLAGAHLNIESLAVAGWLGVLYFLLRAAGKYLGARAGAHLINAPLSLQSNIGMALMPQAGVAIGLIFVLTGDVALAGYGELITPIVLAGVFFSELVGPVFTRRAIINVGETGETICRDVANGSVPGESGRRFEEVKLVPWTWEKLVPPAHQEGCVIFGAAHAGTVAGLARMATLLAHHYGGRPLAARIAVKTGTRDKKKAFAKPAVFAKERNEVRSLGYELDTVVYEAGSVARGLIDLALERSARAIVLGYPLKGTVQEFQWVVEAVAREAPCQVVVARFAGLLHTERILVPVTGVSDLETVRDVVKALAGVGKHRIRLLRLLPPDTNAEELQKAESRLLAWTKMEKLAPTVACRAVATEARLETVLEEESKYDLLVMATSISQGLQKFCFGSLAGVVSQHCRKPLFMVYPPRHESA